MLVGCLQFAGALRDELLEMLAVPPQLLLRFLARGDVPDDRREQRLVGAGNLDPVHGDLDRDRSPVAVHRLELARPAQYVRHAGAAIPGEVAVMRGAVGFRHEHRNIQAAELLRRPAEDPLHRVACGLDDAVRVDRDDRIERRCEDRAVSGDRLPELQIERSVGNDLVGLVLLTKHDEPPGRLAARHVIVAQASRHALYIDTPGVGVDVHAPVAQEAHERLVALVGKPGRQARRRRDRGDDRYGRRQGLEHDLE